MKSRRIIISALTLMLTMSMAITPSMAAAKRVGTPSEVSVTSYSRDNNGDINLEWEKLSKNVAGYEVYIKIGNSTWLCDQKVGKNTSSTMIATMPEEDYQVKVRAYNKGKETKYYNKKTKKYVSKKAYNKLSKKNRSVKTVTVTKKGAFSDVISFDATVNKEMGSVEGTFDRNEDVLLSWDEVNNAKKYEVYRSEGGEYKLIGTTEELSYKDKYYNPAETVCYKVRPMKGSRPGKWSKVLMMRPQDIIVPAGTEVKAVKCSVCKENVTGKEKLELNDTHKVWYCTECGINGIKSHDPLEIAKHIKKKHNETANYYYCNLCLAKYRDEDAPRPDHTYHFFAREDEEYCNQDRNVIEHHIKTFKNHRKKWIDEYGEAIVCTGTFDPIDAQAEIADARTYYGTVCKLDKDHKHNWKVGTKTEKVFVGSKTVEEGHDICQVCDKDLDEWYEFAIKYGKEHGLTGTDITCGSTNPIYAVTVHAHRDKHLNDGAKGAGSTRVDDVEVQKPIYKDAVVTTARCDCGAVRVIR